LLLLFLIGGFFTPYFVVLPIYAKTIFGGDSGTLGALMAAAAVGSLFGTLTLLVQEDLDLTSATLFATAVAGVAVAVFAFNTTLWLAYVLLVIIGYGLILSAAALNVILQTVSEPRFRTRVMQFYAMAYSGVVPFSGLAIGALAHRIGTERALFWFAVSGLTGTACLAGSLPVVRRRARPLRRWVLSPFFSR
jgi:MFS family permease